MNPSPSFSLSRETMASLWDALPLGVLVLNRVGQITYANPKAIAWNIRNSVTEPSSGGSLLSTMPWLEGFVQDILNAPESAPEPSNAPGSARAPVLRPMMSQRFQVVTEPVPQTQIQWIFYELIPLEGGTEQRLVLFETMELTVSGDLPTPNHGSLSLDSPNLWQSAQASGGLDLEESKILLAQAAHELNSPLIGITMCTDLAQRNLAFCLNHLYSEPFSPQSMESALKQAVEELSKINKAAQKGAEWVRDILELSRPSRLDLQPTNICRFLEQIIQPLDLVPMLSHCQIELLPSFDGYSSNVLIDEKKLEQVILNLIQNAAEASPNSCTITIQALPSTLNGSPATMLSISDNGPGIPPSLLGQVFKPFFSTKGTHGNGMGLAICAKIIHQHKGFMGVLSPPNSGCTFYLVLPEAPSPV